MEEKKYEERKNFGYLSTTQLFYFDLTLKSQETNKQLFKSNKVITKKSDFKSVCQTIF